MKPKVTVREMSCEELKEFISGKWLLRVAGAAPEGSVALVSEDRQPLEELARRFRREGFKTEIQRVDELAEVKACPKTTPE